MRIRVKLFGWILIGTVVIALLLLVGYQWGKSAAPKALDHEAAGAPTTELGKKLAGLENTQQELEKLLAQIKEALKPGKQAVAKESELARQIAELEAVVKEGSDAIDKASEQIAEWRKEAAAELVPPPE